MVDIIELKKLLDDNKKQLSDILQDCQNSTPEQALLEAKMRPLLDDFTAIEECLFSQPISQADATPKQDES